MVQKMIRAEEEDPRSRDNAVEILLLHSNDSSLMSVMRTQDSQTGRTETGNHFHAIILGH